VTSDRVDVAGLQPVVEATLRSVLGSNDFEYDDLVQCSLEHVLRAIDKGAYRGTSPLRSWAAAIARNVAIDAIRSRSRDRSLFVRDESEESLEQTPSADDGPERIAEIRGRCEAIEAALLALPPRTAKVVYLHDSLGYRLEEVAASEGMSVAAAQSRLVRGRRRVIDWMSAFESPDDERRAPTARPAGDDG
jgi:RNA polymerase sigma factor (sigma-70 family)